MCKNNKNKFTVPGDCVSLIFLIAGTNGSSQKSVLAEITSKHNKNICIARDIWIIFAMSSQHKPETSRPYFRKHPVSGKFFKNIQKVFKNHVHTAIQMYVSAFG